MHDLDSRQVDAAGCSLNEHSLPFAHARQVVQHVVRGGEHKRYRRALFNADRSRLMCHKTSLGDNSCAQAMPSKSDDLITYLEVGHPFAKSCDASGALLAERGGVGIAFVPRLAARHPCRVHAILEVYPGGLHGDFDLTCQVIKRARRCRYQTECHIFAR